MGAPFPAARAPCPSGGFGTKQPQCFPSRALRTGPPVPPGCCPKETDLPGYCFQTPSPGMLLAFARDFSPRECDAADFHLPSSLVFPPPPPPPCSPCSRAASDPPFSNGFAGAMLGGDLNTTNGACPSPVGKCGAAPRALFAAPCLSFPINPTGTGVSLPIQSSRGRMEKRRGGFGGSRSHWQKGFAHAALSRRISSRRFGTDPGVLGSLWGSLVLGLPQSTGLVLGSHMAGIWAARHFAPRAKTRSSPDPG